mmetsp:Transcript_17426/g.36178  ORF Transcript_17426/g.36178 Transcript_17426/m.36178 type:complete len:87 (-) Transcript_17426:128-388(-)
MGLDRSVSNGCDKNTTDIWEDVIMTVTAIRAGWRDSILHRMFSDTAESTPVLSTRKIEHKRNLIGYYHGFDIYLCSLLERLHQRLP